eukprot:3921815-Pleurochrysis_carterae.AAC.2
MITLLGRDGRLMTRARRAAGTHLQASRNMSWAAASSFATKRTPREVVFSVSAKVSSERLATKRNAGSKSMRETCAMLMGLECSRKPNARWPAIKYVCMSGRKRQPAADSECSLATALNIRRRASSRAQERGVERARYESRSLRTRLHSFS